MKKFTKVICAIIALVMILNTPPQIYAAEPPTDAEKTNLSATGKIEPIEPTPTDPDAKIYGIKLSQNREFLLPGGTLQLTVRGITDPDEIPEIPQSPYLTEDSYSDESNMYLENENELNETYATTIESEDETYELNEHTTQKPEIDAHISTTVAECLPFEWNSCDKEIATVDQNGKVTAISTGTTSITVTTADKVFMDVCEIMVVNKLPDPNNGEANEILSIWDEHHYATAINWTNQYETTTSTTAARTVTPGTAIEILGKSGGFYYARLVGEGKAYYMWADGIYDRTSLGTVDIALKSNISDRRRHRDVYISNKIELSVFSSTNTSCSWKSTNTNIATISPYGVVTAKSEGNVCITVDQGGKKDAIHITVIKKYSPAKYGIVNKNWCGEYRCSNSNCTIQGRKVTDWAPNSELIIYGISGGFYYGKIVSSNNYTYFWKDNVSLQTWFPNCELDKSTDSSRKFVQQGFAVDNNYCYAFQVVMDNNQNEIGHRLYRYNIHTGEKILMTPHNVKDLYHANDAALVTFSKNGVSQQYLFVVAYSPSKTNYLVKLAINPDGSYSEEARYTLNYGIKVVGITLIHNYNQSTAVFLLKSGRYFYTATIMDSQKNKTDVWMSTPSPTITLVGNGLPDFTAQGIHYEAATDKLYLSFSFIYSIDRYNRVYMYSNIHNFIGEKEVYNSLWDINKFSTQNDTKFEIEGIAFRPNQTDKRLWFQVYEGRSQNGHICTDSQDMR